MRVSIKQIIVFCCVFLGFNATFGQLYIRDAYVYVGDKSIFVKEEINLNTANSFIYLRNDSQILQGRSGVSNNVGLGAVSVFQEGTSNQFAYNFWGSPVGGSNATVGNSNFGISQLGAPTSVIATTPATILPNGNPNGLAALGTVSVAQRWIFTFASALTYSAWNFIGAASTIAPGLGFTMKGTGGTDTTTGTTVRAGSTVTNNPGSAQRYDFRGKPNDGNITAPVAAGQLTLVGNPYPSAIDTQTFLSLAENPNCDGTALFWNQPNASSTSHNTNSYRGGYQVYNSRSGINVGAPIYAYDGGGTQIGASLGTGTNFDRKFAPVGQGFMIRGAVGIAGGAVVTFRNTHRVEQKENGATSVFNRTMTATEGNKAYPNYPNIPNVAGIDYTKISTAPTPHIIINGLLNNTGVRQIALVFMPNALDGYDRADSVSADANGSLPFDMYLFMNNTEFVHSAKAFTMDKTFQLGFKNNVAAKFRVQVGDFVNFSAANFVYLHDKVTNQYYDIKNTPYEFSMPAGVNNTRYQITFTNGTLSTPSITADSFDVFQNNTSSLLTIRNPKNIDLKSCNLFDITGKMIFAKTNLGSAIDYTFSTSGLSEGVYILNIITAENEKVGKKIIISKID